MDKYHNYYTVLKTLGSTYFTPEPQIQYFYLRIYLILEEEIRLYLTEHKYYQQILNCMKVAIFTLLFQNNAMEDKFSVQ
jgi:hypothetical protein